MAKKTGDTPGWMWGVLGILLLILLVMYFKKTRIEHFTNLQKYENPDRILLINLESRPDRYANFMQSASHNNIPYPIERLSAVKGADVTWQDVLAPDIFDEYKQFLRTGKRKGHRSLTPGAIGCYLSHLNALQRVVNADKPMIICEDDGVFVPNSLQGIQSALKRVPYDENTMILFHIICTPENHICTPLLTDPGVMDVVSFWSTACYYVTPTAAKTLLRHAKPIRVQIDSYMSDLRKENKLNIFSLPCVNTGNFGTDIQAPIEN